MLLIWVHGIIHAALHTAERDGLSHWLVMLAERLNGATERQLQRL
jgi:hypothetical protein